MLRQPAAALHRLGPAQHRPARARRQAGALGLRARDPRDRVGHGRQVRDRGRGLRAPRARLHRAGAARGQRRDRRGRQRRAARARRARRHPRRPALPHHALRRAQLARRDGRGGEARAATPTSRSPTTRPATGSATTSPRRRSRQRIEEIAAWNATQQGPLHAARRLGGQHPPRRLARLRARAARAPRLGRRQRPHLVPDLGRRR